MKMKAIAVAISAAMLSLSAAAQDPKKPADDKAATPPQTTAPDSKPQGAAAGDTAKAKKPGKAEADKEKEKKK